MCQITVPTALDSYASIFDETAVTENIFSIDFNGTPPSVVNILKQNRFYLKTHTKSLKIKEINQENPENHFNLGITLQARI
jgi:hypothetical protein